MEYLYFNSQKIENGVTKNRLNDFFETLGNSSEKGKDVLF